MQIVFKADSTVIGFKGMQGDIDLVQPGRSQQDVLLLAQQGAVGGEDHPEAGISRNFQIPLQPGMQQGFPHQVKIKIVAPGTQLWHQGEKLRFAKHPRRPVSSRAEAAVQIADIGYFQIDFSESHNQRNGL